LEASALNGLGTIHSALSDYRQALNLWQQALRLSRELGDREGEVDLLNNLGAISATTGAAQQALDYYQQALSIAREVGYRRMEARLLLNVGVRYLALGEPHRAAERLQEALALARALGLRDDQAGALHNLSGAWLQLGEYQRALDSDNQALALFRAAGYRRGEVAALLLLGQIHQRLGDLPAALDHFQQALALSRQAGYRNEEAIALNNLGALHQARGESPQALDYLQQAVALHRAMGARASLPSDLSQLGVARLARDETELAAENFREALALSRELGIPRFEVSALLYLGRIYRTLGKREQAAESLRRALELSRAINYVYLEAEALRELTLLALGQGDYPLAQAQIEQAIKLIETARAKVGSQDLRASFRGRSQNFYEALIETLMRRREQDPAGDYAALAFQASEQSRARSLIELLNEARAEIRQGVAPELLTAERELRQKLEAKSNLLARTRASDLNKESTVALKNEIANLIAEYSEVQTRIRLTSPRYAALTAPEPLKLSEIQKQALDANTLLLEYSLGERRSYLFAVTPSAIHSFTLPGREEIETKARLFYRLVTERGKSRVFRSAAENRQWLARNDQESKAAALALSQMLLGPAAELLGKKRLLIVGDGILHYVPFGALPEPRTRGQGDKGTEKLPLISPSPCPLVSFSADRQPRDHHSSFGFGAGCVAARIGWPRERPQDDCGFG
jgi:tetratricopeptide (TPR) repeat protein